MSVIQWSWFIIGISVVFEFVGTMALKYSNGFSLFWPSLVTVLFYAGAVGLMAVASKVLDVSIMYSLWASSSAALIAVGSYWLFSEHFTVYKATGVGLLIASIFVLNLGDLS